MDDPLATDPRYRRAVYRAMWFAAVSAFAYAALAAFSWAGLMGKEQDAPTLLLMALGGSLLFIFTRVIIRIFRA